MGGALRRERQTKDFREALNYCGFRDLGFMGAPYTWCNNQFDGIITWIRLDKGVATSSWIQMFPSDPSPPHLRFTFRSLSTMDLY